MALHSSRYVRDTLEHNPDTMFQLRLDEVQVFNRMGVESKRRLSFPSRLADIRESAWQLARLTPATSWLLPQQVLAIDIDLLQAELPLSRSSTEDLRPEDLRFARASPSKSTFWMYSVVQGRLRSC